MSEKLELVREALDAFLRGEFERARELADPDIVCLRAPPLPDSQTYHGVDGVLQMYTDWTADFDEFEMEALGFSEVDDRVLVEVIQRGRGRASGAAVEGLLADLHRRRRQDHAAGRLPQPGAGDRIR